MSRLSEIRTRLGDLRELLAEEYRLLGAGKVDGIEGLLSVKRRLLEDLATTEPDDLKLAFEGTGAWDGFVDELRDCRRRNLVNGATMSAILKTRGDAFRLLLGHSRGHGDGYRANGRIAPDAPSREIGSA